MSETDPRLDALTEAAERNGRRQVNNEAFERFFGLASRSATAR
jgi:hypothetical protein